MALDAPHLLNEIAEHVLQAHVDGVLNALADVENDELRPLPPKVAEFITADVLLRLHNLVADARRKGHACGGWTKQAALARVVATFTGVNVSKVDAEYIGNAQDYFLKDYVKQLSKAAKSDARAVCRARQAGKGLPAAHGKRMTELKLQAYKCKYGGVPRNVVLVDTSEHPRQAQPIEPVPLRTVCYADEVNIALQKRIIELKERADSGEREKRQNMHVLCQAVEGKMKEERRVEQAAAKAAKAQEEAAAAQERVHQALQELAEAKATAETSGREAKRWKQRATDSLQKCAKSERECELKTNELLCMTGKLVSALSEAAQEQRKRKRTEEIAQKEASQLRADLDAAICEVDECKKKVREGERACIVREGEVLRLEGKLVRAFAEAQGEQSKRLRFEAVAVKEVAHLQSDLQAARSEAEACKQQVRLAERTCSAKQGEVFRLEGKLGRALTEAKLAQDLAKCAQSEVVGLKQKMTEQGQAAEAEKEHLRNLKNKMAQEKRDAQRLALSAKQLHSKLMATKQRLKELHMEANVTRVRLSKVYEMPSGESSSDSSLEESDEEFLPPCLKTKPASNTLVPQTLTSSMQSWSVVPRGAGAGKGASKYDWGYRVVIYSLLSMLVPPSAIGPAIIAIVKRTAPWLQPRAPTTETIRRCRFELRLVEETLAARRVAAAFRIRGIGFDETTKLGNSSLTSNVSIEPTEGAPLEDVILRAAYCPLGGTSELQVKSIEDRCFSRLRGHLNGWKAMFENMFPNEKWSGPSVSQCSLHRLGGGGAIMSDTCNAARRAKKLLADFIASEVEQDMGAEQWSRLSDTEQTAATRTHQCDCWQHLRNIFLAEMSRKQAAHVQQELKPELDTFSAWERMNTDFNQLLRASFKEFHHSCRYYKGQGRSYGVWLRDTYPKSFCLHLERADGGRQDLDYDAAIPLYIDRKYFVEFLHERVFAPKHSNILEDFLYVTFRATQYIAMTRANAIVDILISRPLRWLSGKSRELRNWSPFSMGKALDLVEQFFIQAQHNGRLFLDPSLDIFKEIADDQPLFAEWRTFSFEHDTRLSPDGSVKFLIYKVALDELLSPKDTTNAATELKTVEYLEVQCQAALQKMHDPKLALRDKLASQDGENCVSNSADAHADTKGCHATNDSLAESVFGTYDMLLKRCQGISMEAASGVAQAVRSKFLGQGDHIARRKVGTHKIEEDCIGWMHRLPEHEQEALVELARTTVKECRDVDRADHNALDEYHKSRRKTNEQEELDALFTQYALALSFFERWQKRGVQLAGQVTQVLNSYGDRQQDKLDWLREQIEMRTVGLGWHQLATCWSSSKDDEVGTVDQLREQLKLILMREQEALKEGELPSKDGRTEDECPTPQMRRKTFKSLGTPTVQANALCDARTELSQAELLEKACQRRIELEKAGEIDWVCDRQPFPTGQGPTPDEQLIGKVLEVRWRYHNKDTGKPVYIWCEGTVEQVADGENDKKSARCKKILPAGALRIKWPSDVDFDEDESFVWSILKPSAFNRDVHLGWRFAASEIQRMEAKKSAKGARKTRT